MELELAVVDGLSEWRGVIRQLPENFFNRRVDRFRKQEIHSVSIEPVVEMACDSVMHPVAWCDEMPDGKEILKVVERHGFVQQRLFGLP